MELVVTVCLLAHPLTCKRVHLPFPEPVSDVQCLRWSQPSLAVWSGDHPGWTIRAWRCAAGMTASR